MSLRKETPYEEMQKSFSDYKEGVDTSHLEKWTISKNKKSMDKNKHLTSSLRHPKTLIKEFSYFLMPCHQHGLRINLLA